MANEVLSSLLRKRAKPKTSTYLSESRASYSYQSQKGTLLQFTYVKAPEQAILSHTENKMPLQRG